MAEKFKKIDNAKDPIDYIADIPSCADFLLYRYPIIIRF